MIKIIDTFNSICEMKEKVVAEEVDILTLWKKYISPHPQVKELCLQDSATYDFDKDVKPVIMNALSSDFKKLELAHTNFISEIVKIEKQFYNTFPIKDDILVYFYLGLANGAGWVTIVNNKQSVLLGVEKIVELNWHSEKRLVALMCHELAHVAHSVLRNESLTKEFSTVREKSIWHLYIEGFAQRYQQILYGSEFYHQDRDGWLNWCQDNHEHICQEYLYRLINDLSTQDFFGDWVSFKGHSDVGYYLGCEFIKSIAGDYSVDSLAKLTMFEIQGLVIEFLGN